MSWDNPCPVRPLQVCVDVTHQCLSLHPRFKCFIVLYQPHSPWLFLEFGPAYTYGWTQFKHEGHRWWRRLCHCGIAAIYIAIAATGNPVD